MLSLIVAGWIVGVVRLFQKQRRILAWIALSGVIIPFLAPVALIGWYIKPNPQVAMKPPD